jgi:hypothetical protein
MENRDTCIFYRSIYESLQELDLENQAIIYNAIFEFSLNFNEPNLSGINKAFFGLIRPVLEKGNTNFINGSKPKRKPNGSELEAKPKRIISEHDAYKDKDKDKDEDNDKDKDKIDLRNQLITGKWFKKCTEAEFIAEVERFRNENPNNGYPEIIFKDFINHYTTPNENGGIRVNQFSSFGIKNKLYDWWRDKNNDGKYDIKITPKSKLHYE